jgi:hypothetical protein
VILPLPYRSSTMMGDPDAMNLDLTRVCYNMKRLELPKPGTSFPPSRADVEWL